ncbi:RluA family pseudouridine synthase [Rosistilla oblonga]|uniref:RluA family pseudouridine synthase n=1 Tax=Rosistilla oblonga TaxID=2527990 RepID=UPI003A97F766
MTTLPFPILYEDNHLLVIDKPAGIATQGVTDGTSVFDQASEYIRVKYQKPGKVYLGIVSRLDTVTSGVLVLARTSKAASRLSDMLRRRTIEKRYLAVVEGQLPQPEGTLVDFVRKDDAAHRMVVSRESTADAKRAELRYRVIESSGRQSLIEVELITGRKHQIRLQLASRGMPVIGDRKYDASSTFPQGIALHAWQLTFEHPTKREPMSFECRPPKSWQRLSVQLP